MVDHEPEILYSCNLDAMLQDIYTLSEELDGMDEKALRGEHFFQLENFFHLVSRAITEELSQYLTEDQYKKLSPVLTSISTFLMTKGIKEKLALRILQISIKLNIAFGFTAESLNPQS